eukprot:scaffold106695_cov35-Tisochrysis_lutea.AAC.2
MCTSLGLASSRGGGLGRALVAARSYNCVTSESSSFNAIGKLPSLFMHGHPCGAMVITDNRQGLFEPRQSPWGLNSRPIPIHER